MQISPIQFNFLSVATPTSLFYATVIMKPNCVFKIHTTFTEELIMHSTKVLKYYQYHAMRYNSRTTLSLKYIIRNSILSLCMK